MPQPSDRVVHAFPVSVKGVAIQGGKILLLLVMPDGYKRSVAARFARPKGR